MRFYKPNKGATLPTLTKPAGPADIILDKEAINGSGQKLVGKLKIAQAVTENLGAAMSLETYDRADGIRGLKIIGSLGDATAADIVKGKTASTDDGKITGTLEVTGGKPSYSLQIATRNDSDGKDSVIYYAPGTSAKMNLTLTPAYKHIVCGEFICLYRGSTNRVSGIIECMDADNITLLSIGVTSKYGVEHNYNKGWTTLNIGAIKKDYPLVSKIMLDYMD